jgi:thiamine-phosphate pyrophosphorylase
VHDAEERRRLLREARLYAITADDEPHRIEAAVRASLRGGAQVVQLRHKGLRRGALISLARTLRPIVADARALFIVNDHLDVAIACGADGVHLGADDLSIAAARRVAGTDMVIGASASTPEAAQTAERDAADYIGSGAAFSTPIKAERRAIGPAAIAAVAASVRIPVFAIGGVDESNVEQLVAAGVRRVCVIRALFATPDPEAAARKLRAVLDAAS